MERKFQSLDDSKFVRQIVLANMYKIIGDSMKNGDYAFKGGYILSKKLKDKDFRRTTDIDLIVLDERTFELAIMSLHNYLYSLVQKGVIWDYKITMPEVTKVRNKSGGVKLYVKYNNNSRKRVLCGIDISIHPLNQGVELSAEGYSQYSNELMLSDKVSALYMSEKNVIRRIRDALDIYLILGMCDNTLNKLIILNKIKERNINIQELSTLELLLKKIVLKYIVI